jgi:hypothetical protein
METGPVPPSSSKGTRAGEANEATEALLEVMRLAAPEADGHTLMKSILDHLRNWVGCEAAGLRLKDGQDFPYYEVRGFPAEFVELERYLCAR